MAAAQEAATYSHKRASSSGTGQIQPRTSSKIMTANSSIQHASVTSAGVKQKPMVTSTLLDVMQTDVLLSEFEKILNIKRGKQLQALKVEKIYERIHLIEDIVDRSCNAEGQILQLEQLQDFALNLGALQMVNFLPHMDIIPVHTLNRINLLMGKAQQELARQFERKVLDFSQSGQKYEEVLAQLKTKERQLIETTAELDWTKSALKSGEVKDFMARLPGLLMETTEKTLIKQEAALLNEQHRLRMQQDNSIRHKSPKTSQGIDMQTLLKTTNQSRSAATASKRGHRSVNNDRKLRQAVMEVEPQQLFREESDSKSEGSDDFMTFDQKPARVGGTGAKNSSRDLSNGS